MCGIYGLVMQEGVVVPEAIVAQRDRLYHRGPDDAGLWISPSRQVGLAHRRLSIIDLSAAGRQPMASHDGRYVIVFNGEIYNYLALRSELASLGYVFKSASDTEVILNAYQAWGDKCLDRFNGMYSLAIYDHGDAGKTSSLFLARDRAGKKPLYYAHQSRRFEFASELKAISTHAGLDLNAVNHYLALGYVPHDLCIVAGVAKLPPAHAARFDLASGKLRVWRYWTLPANCPATDADSEALADEAGTLIEDATRLRLAADVPVGVLLSGGLDSSLIVAAASRVSSAPVQTFTIALPGSRLDESAYARIVARHFGAQHHELPLADSGLATLGELAPFVDEPIADSSLIPTYLVSKLTRRHVTVALGGDGGDELFGGYGDYGASLADARRLRYIPKSIVTLAARAASRLPAGVRGRNRVASLRGGACEQMIWGRPYFDTSLRRRILSGKALDELGPNLEAPEQFLYGLFQTGSDDLDRMTRTHFGSILPDDFLAKVDRASMMVSLEMRSPLLDHRLVEFAFGRVPSYWKVHGNETRRIQKILARRWLPSELDVDRKQGFSVPMDSWLRADSRRLAELPDRLPDFICRDEVARLVAGLEKGRANGARIFCLEMLGIAARNLRG